MTFASDLVSRLEQRRSRIQGMLSPGSSKLTGEGTNASLSPVANDFAGRKFQLAAKKMRVLGEGSIKPLLSSTGSSLGSDVLSKFQAIEKIIHINPKTIQDNSTWSEVEAILPGGSNRSVRETPQPEGGILRQGSIIQKFKTTPGPRTVDRVLSQRDRISAEAGKKCWGQEKKASGFPWRQVVLARSGDKTRTTRDQ